MISKIKAGLDGLTINNFILKVRYILSMLAGNTNFPNLPFLPSEVEADVNALTTIQAQVVAGNRLNIGSRDALKKGIALKMAANAAYVNGLAMNNPSMLETSGFEPAKAPVSHTVPAEVIKLVCKPTQPVNAVKLTWKAVKERDYYTIQQRIGELGTWQDIGTCTKPNYVVNSLPPKEEVFFRVAAANGVGVGLWSNVDSFIVA